MIRLLPVILVIGALLALAIWMLVSARRQSRAERAVAQFEREVQNLVLDHIDVAPTLAKAALNRLRTGPVDPAHDDLAGDLVDLAIIHRDADPEFATILTDTVRQHAPQVASHELD